MKTPSYLENFARSFHKVFLLRYTFKLSDYCYFHTTALNTEIFLTHTLRKYNRY